MALMKLPLWVAVSFAYATLAACQAQRNEAEPAPPTVSAPLSISEADVPTLEYIGTELRAYGYDDDPYYRFMDIIRFSNQTPVAWEFWGEDVTWPPWNRAFLTPGRVWQQEPRAFCGTFFENRRIEPGQVVLFPAHSTRVTYDVNSGTYSRVQLELTNAQSGEKALVFTEGYRPRTKNEDEALARKLDRRDQLK